MNVWVESLTNGLKVYLKVLPIMIIITVFLIYIIKSKIRLLYFIGVQAIVLYLICLIELVLFPLPSPNKIATLHGYKGQFIPFNFIFDIAEDRSLESILQVILNVLMTVPFGFFLKFFLNIKRRNIVIMTFLLTLTIELAQLTGLFFTYPGSYRLFDVDDMMMNILGGFLGTVLANNINSIVPDIYKDRFILYPIN